MLMYASPQHACTAAPCVLSADGANPPYSCTQAAAAGLWQSMGSVAGWRDWLVRPSSAVAFFPVFPKYLRERVPAGWRVKNSKGGADFALRVQE